MLEEHWKVIPDFPDYSVSDLGNIMNNRTGRDMRLSLTPVGIVKVGLVKAGKQHTRSVKVLVAEAFVPGRSEIFDTPVQLDGYPENNMITNLVWRPRWFAWKYTRQFTDGSEYASRGPIYDIESRRKYVDVYEAAILNGLLFVDIWRSINLQHPCFPTEQVFAFVR